MNALKLYTNAYGSLHNYKGVPYWLLTPFRKLIRNVANRVLPKYLTKHCMYRGKQMKGFIISFTSFPTRIHIVWQVVESLKRQSVLPEKIILWLSKEQFPSRESIPESLWKEEDKLFEIRMVNGDIRSHKKFYYAMREYADKAIVTCDDDIYYHPDMLKILVYDTKENPNCIIANTTKQIVFDTKGENRVQIGVGGVLYPPHSLHNICLREDLFVKLTPLADDLWLNMVARLNKTPIVQSSKEILPLPINVGGPSLKTINAGAESMNDIQIKNMRAWLIENGYEDVYCANI